MARKIGKSRTARDVERVQLTIEEDDGQTHQSFKDECDINRIIDLHTRTGIVTHLARGKPQYAECPEQTLFEAACIQAEINTLYEEGFEPSSEASQDAQSDSDTEPEAPVPESVTEPQDAAQEVSQG